MLEEIIVSLIEKRKKIYGAGFSFVAAILFLEYGILKTIFVILITFVGYQIVDSNMLKKIRKKIIKRLED